MWSEPSNKRFKLSKQTIEALEKRLQQQQERIEPLEAEVRAQKEAEGETQAGCQFGLNDGPPRPLRVRGRKSARARRSGVKSWVLRSMRNGSSCQTEIPATAKFNGYRRLRCAGV